MTLIHLTNQEGNDLVFQTWSTLLDLFADVQKGEKHYLCFKKKK